MKILIEINLTEGEAAILGARPSGKIGATKPVARQPTRTNPLLCGGTADNY